MDSCASRSPTSSPSHAMQDADFTAEEKKFSTRYEGEYDISNEWYQAWLEVNHPESVHQTSAAALNLELPEPCLLHVLRPYHRHLTRQVSSLSMACVIHKIRCRLQILNHLFKPASGRPLADFMTVYASYRYSHTYITLNNNICISSNVHLTLKDDFVFVMNIVNFIIIIHCALTVLD